MIPPNADRITITDAEAAAHGREVAELDLALGRKPATDEEILAPLERFASGEVTGWAQEAAIRAYRDTYRRLRAGRARGEF